MQTYNYLKHFYGNNPQKPRECCEKLAEYCSSVLEECMATMTDKDLDIMLEEYRQCLWFADVCSRRLSDLMSLRVDVAERLATNSFRSYGRKLADTLSQRAYYLASERAWENNRAAIDDFERSIALYRTLPDRNTDDVEKLIAFALHNLTELYFFENQYRKAVECNKQSLELYTRLGDETGIWLCNRDREEYLQNNTSRSVI